MPGPQKSFDPEAAVGRALELFWRQGYEATGLKQLLPHMGIGYQSLYDTFGSKGRLYARALERYSADGLARLGERLAAPGSPLANVRSVVGGWAQRVTEAPTRGCFVNNSITELGSRDAAVAAVARTHLARVQAAYEDALTRARDAGELRPDADPRALARFLMMAAQGLMVMGQAGLEPEAIHDMVEVVLSTLR